MLLGHCLLLLCVAGLCSHVAMLSSNGLEMLIEEGAHLGTGEEEIDLLEVLDVFGILQEVDVTSNVVRVSVERDEVGTSKAFNVLEKCAVWKVPAILVLSTVSVCNSGNTAVCHSTFIV